MDACRFSKIINQEEYGKVSKRSSKNNSKEGSAKSNTKNSPQNPEKLGGCKGKDGFGDKNKILAEFLGRLTLREDTHGGK